MGIDGKIWPRSQSKRSGTGAGRTLSGVFIELVFEIDRFDGAHAALDLGDDVARSQLRKSLERHGASIFFDGRFGLDFEFFFGLLFLRYFHRLFHGPTLAPEGGVRK